MNTLEAWTDAVCADLGIAPTEIDRDLILDLTKEVAHGVARPAAPLTAFVVGLAIGRGASAKETVDTVAARARSWSEATQR